VSICAAAGEFIISTKDKAVSENRNCRSFEPPIFSLTHRNNEKKKIFKTLGRAKRAKLDGV
jgi:hypothetical protein